jgi:flagellar FliJ protein
MENILQVNIKLEDQAKIAYSNARMILNREEEKLEEYIKRKMKYESELRNLTNSKLDIKKIKLCREAIEVMESKIRQQRIVVKNAEARVEAARVKLNDAMVERKTQENLKEKAFQEYLIELDLEERKEVDELISFRYGKPAIDEENG